MYWYQKEYSSGEFFEALKDISAILKENFFCGAELRDDAFHMRHVLHRICELVMESSSKTDNLVLEANGFIWKRGGKEEIFCMCKKIGDGWIFKISGCQDIVGQAGEFGWKKLTNNLSSISPIGPSQMATLLYCHQRL